RGQALLLPQRDRLLQPASRVREGQGRHAGGTAGEGWPSRRGGTRSALPARRVDDYSTARARQLSPPRDDAGEQLPTSPHWARGPDAVVGHGRTRRQHAGSEAGGDAALVVARTRDAEAVRVEAPRERRNFRPVRELRVHGQRSVRVRKGGGILFWPVSTYLHRRC